MRKLIDYRPYKRKVPTMHILEDFVFHEEWRARSYARSIKICLDLDDGRITMQEILDLMGVYTLDDEQEIYKQIGWTHEDSDRFYAKFDKSVGGWVICGPRPQIFKEKL